MFAFVLLSETNSRDGGHHFSRSYGSPSVAGLHGNTPLDWDQKWVEVKV